MYFFPKINLKITIEWIGPKTEDTDCNYKRCFIFVFLSRNKISKSRLTFGLKLKGADYGNTGTETTLYFWTFFKINQSSKDYCFLKKWSIVSAIKMVQDLQSAKFRGAMFYGVYINKFNTGFGNVDSNCKTDCLSIFKYFKTFEET